MIKIGLKEWVTVTSPLPSWPTAFFPQQYREESFINAQEWSYPATTELTVLFEGSETGPGTRLESQEPCPICPHPPIPQQYAERLSNTVHE